MGGGEAIGHVKKMLPELPVFVSSGYSDDPVIANPTMYGFKDSIRKPYSSQEIADMLAKYIEDQED